MKVFIPALLILSVLASCKKDQSIAVSSNPFEVHPSTMVSKNLVEVFTGEWTPQNVNSATSLQAVAQDSNNVFAVQYHDNDFLETPYTDIVSAEIFGNVSYYPSGSVNRTPAQQTENSEDGLILYSPNNWKKNSDIIENKEAICSMALETSIDQNNFLNISIYTYHEEAIPSELLLQVYIVEDNIPEQNQLNAPTGFVHNNVFRASIPNDVGVPLDLSPKANDGRIVKTTIPGADMSSYNLANTKIIAFIYNKSWSTQLRTIVNVQMCRAGGQKFWN